MENVAINRKVFYETTISSLLTFACLKPINCEVFDLLVPSYQHFVWLHIKIYRAYIHSIVRLQGFTSIWNLFQPSFNKKILDKEDKRSNSCGELFVSSFLGPIFRIFEAFLWASTPLNILLEV